MEEKPIVQEPVKPVVEELVKPVVKPSPKKEKKQQQQQQEKKKGTLFPGGNFIDLFLEPPKDTEHDILSERYGITPEPEVVPIVVPTSTNTPPPVQTPWVAPINAWQRPPPVPGPFPPQQVENLSQYRKIFFDVNLSPIFPPTGNIFLLPQKYFFYAEKNFLM